MKTNLPELLNAIPHGIVLLDTKLCIVAINRSCEGLVGYSSDEVSGIYSDFILRTNLGNNDQVCRKVLEDGLSVSKEGNLINKRREKIPIQFTISRLHDLRHKPTGILIVLEDISALQAKKADLQGDDQEFGIIGHSRQMEEVFELMSVLARTDASVLITGETGTGKDKIAEQLHKLSQRGRKPFIKVNCGALPAALLESELFGHVKGAFTGAVNDNIGMFRLADKGTIFLTEIGDLSLPLQVKLLSVLDDHAFYPVGGSKQIEIDVRIIAATHRSLRMEVEQGRFREDLFYRLNVLHLHIPPLRERDGDIPLLLDHFLRQFRTKLARDIIGFNRKSIDRLSSYHYPGNVRELRNIVEYAVTFCQEKKIGVKDLPQYLVKPTKSPRVNHTDHVDPSLSSPPPEQSVQAKTGGWAEAEKENIMDALVKTGGNRSKAAELLGWGRTTLWRKIKKYRLT
ncbi:PAS domain S-box protein [Desulfopila sp. IMCC35006]|uniref:sigma-54 interaction domain-containing protein n=1 Tax=Desulfopila sp. IMCC35006 TaxID=2569542 RepID=UPI0010ACE521|nr:sigma 54-interacting transcriptional regulator [Desulfopila sp. IMCC35006]TKB24401.1 PAS domain S-box protein [Desulfopila sp. IMCC35006]